MSDDSINFSSDYRATRNMTSVFFGIGIAWAAAQFDIKELSLGPLGSVSIDNSWIPFIIGSLSIFMMFRTTLEFMMQPKKVRRAPLAKLDYRVTIYLVRFNIVVLSVATFYRTWEIVLYSAISFLLAILLFFVLIFAFIFLTIPYRMRVRSRSGIKSVAGAAVEAYYFSAILAGLVYVGIIILMALNIINPFAFFGDKFLGVTAIQLMLFSGVVLFVVIQFFTDERFFAMVFASVPLRIERRYFEDGHEIISIEPNPDHPDFEKIKDEPAMKLRKVYEDGASKSNETEN